MAKFANRVKVSTATTGTGTLTLGSAVADFKSFADAITALEIADGDTVGVVIKGAAGVELSLGVVGAAGTTLTRVLVWSTTGSLLSLTGTSTVEITALAAHISHQDIRFTYAPTGQYILADNINNTVGADFGAANTLYALPFSRKVIADAIAFTLNTATPSSTCRLGLYEADGVDYGPGTLIDQTGSISCNTTGDVVGTLTADLIVDRPVWIVVQTGGTAPKFRGGANSGINATQNSLWPQTTVASTVAGSGFSFARTDAALPSTFPGTARTSRDATGLPIVALRVT